MAKQYSSDSRVILATSFPVLREIVLEYARPKAVNQWIFDQQQLEQISLSPHHTFLWKDIAEVGVEIITLRKETYELRLKLLQQENLIKDAIEQLRQKSNADPKKLAEVEKKLLVQYQRTEDSLQTLNTLLNSAVQKLAGQLDSLMTTHDQEWRDHRKKFTEKLINVLEENNLLFENEKARLLNYESVSELLQDFRG